MKKLISKASVTFILLASLTTTSVLAETPSLQLVIDSIPTTSGGAPIIKNGRTLAPIRVISESLGASVHWDKATQKVTIKKDADIVELTIGKLQAKVNGKTQILDQAPIVHNNSTMLPLRFIGETLGCDVAWDAKTRTVTVTSTESTDVKPSVSKKDQWGRAIRTTNLPKNANLFPYVVEGVPNWVYEQINMTNRALISESGVSSTPKQLFNRENPSDTLDYNRTVDLLNEYFDTILNIDYRTIDENKFINFVQENYHPNGIPSSFSNGADMAKSYLQYIKANKIIVSAEFEVLPEMFWENNLDTNVVSAYVKLTVKQSNAKYGFDSLGFTASSNTGNTGGKVTKVGKTYEGLVQFRLTGYKVDYNTSSVTCQIHPELNSYGGAKKTNNPY